MKVCVECKVVNSNEDEVCKECDGTEFKEIIELDQAFLDECAG